MPKRITEFLRKPNDGFSANALGHNGRTDYCHAGGRALSTALGGSRFPALRHAARYRHRAGDSERNWATDLSDFRESAGVWSHGDHARGIRYRVCLWRIAGRLLERADDRKTPVPFAGDGPVRTSATDRPGVGAESDARVRCPAIR